MSYVERDFKEAYIRMKERALDAERDRDALVKALEWYAKDYDHALGCSQWDGGARARAILADVGGVGK